MIDTMHLWIIAFVAIVGLSLVTESVWSGICYFIFAVGALAFWWALAITVGLLPWPL
jgi:hypothetical protein